ncbi:MAG: FAD-binding protein, partial [Planctomycetota bacterium]
MNEIILIARLRSTYEGQMDSGDLTYISEWLDTKKIKYELNADLSRRTWIKNGGIAGLYIVPENLLQLEHNILEMTSRKMRYIVVGHTSNMFFANSFNPPVVVTTKKINKFITTENAIISECGASLMKVSRECIRRGIAGFEGLVGIPGTVGAAAINNSGAYGCEMSRLVDRVEVLLADGKKVWLTNNELEYAFRDSAIKRGIIECCVMRVELSVRTREKPEILQSLAEEYTATRKKYYESYNKNLGTTVYNMDIVSGRPILKVLLGLHRYLTLFLPFAIQNKTRIIIILLYFNKLNLYPYISKKRMNCFI